MVRTTARPNAHGVTAVALVVVLAVVVFANSWGTFTPDTKPEVYLAPGRMLHEYLSAWTFSPYLGAPSFNGGLSAVSLVTWLISLTGLSPELVFKVFHLALWLIAASGASRLGRRLDQRMGWPGGLVVAIVYVANPYAVTAGATLPVLLPLAFLPWQVLTLVRAADEPARWRWPALFGLSFFLMSGINAGVVPVMSLLAVVPTLIYLRGRCELTWRQVTTIAARCALFVLWASLYWLIPAVSASSTGATIVQGTETNDVIAAVSSFAEVLRGLGLWPLYGSNGGVPWVPDHALYLTKTAIIVITFTASALGLAALADVSRRLARYLVSLLALAAVVMVGMHPPESSSPFGRLLLWLFDRIPVLSAFRTTNKIGAVLVLAFALGAGLVLRTWWHRAGSLRSRVVLLSGGAVLVVLVSLPAFTGHLYTSPFNVPDYWTKAGATLDAEDPTGRVMVLPGTVTTHYRWSDERPDDVLNSVFSRPTFAPVTVANTSAEGVNLTAALDDTFQSATSQGPYTSTFARYLGATDLLLRHDLVWEDHGGVRPGQTQRTVTADGGLRPLQNFGDPGENVASPTVQSEPFTETQVPPLQQYRVTSATPQVRAGASATQVVVAGDGWSVPAMTRRGLLVGVPTFRYAQDLSNDDWSSALGSGRRLVLTDTNRRRSVIPQRLVDGQGPLLRADQKLPSASRTLGTDPADETVLRVVGGRVEASARGYAFFDTPWGTAENAFDGNPETAWIPGDYGGAKGQSIELDFDEPRNVGQIEVTEAALGPVRIGKVTVEAGDVKKTVSLDSDGTTKIDVGATAAKRVRLRIDSLSGSGVSSPGIAQITVPGARIDRIAELPRTFDMAYQNWSGERRASFDTTPLDVLLTRAQGGPGAADDEERTLERSFSLPDARRLAPNAWIHLDTKYEDLYDKVEGVQTGAVSSGRWFDQSSLRASMAFDGDPKTGWAPDVTQGAHLALAGRPRKLASIRFEQRILPGGFETSWARRIEVRSDGKLLTTATVKPGANKIPLTNDGSKVTVGNLELTIVASDPAGTGITPPWVTDVKAGITLKRHKKGSCISVANLDGAALLMRPIDAASPDGSDWNQCTRPSDLTAGLHTLRAVEPGIVVDSFDLTDLQPSASPVARVPDLSVKRGWGATMTITPSTPADAPYYLVIGEGYDDRWRASIGGRDLGRPIVVDGYSIAWLVDPSDGSGPIDVRYGPQRSTNVALAASGVGILVMVWLGLTPWACRRWAGFDRGLVRVQGWMPAVRRPSMTVRRSRGSSLSPVPRVKQAAGLREASGWLLVIAAAEVFGSWPGLIAGAVLAVIHVVSGRWDRRPAPRLLIRFGGGLVLLAGIVWVFALGDMRGTVTPALVADHPWANALAAAGLLTVVVGVWRRHDEN